MVQDIISEGLEQYDYVEGNIIEKKKYDYAFEIGLFLIEFSQFEHELNLNLAELFSDRAHEEGYIVISQLSISMKLELYKKLLTRRVIYLHGDKDKNKKLEKVDKFIKLAKSIIEFRNTIAHCNWYSLKEKGMIRVKIEFNGNLGGMVTFKNKQIYPRTIKNFILKIQKSLNTLSEFYLSEF